MTAEHIHDALTLLPADLIAETDKKRSQPPRIIPWTRYAAMAACFALVLSSSWFCMKLFSPKGATEAQKEAPAEAASILEQSNSFQGADTAAEAAEEPAAPEEALCALPPAAALEEGAQDDIHTDTTAGSGVLWEGFSQPRYVEALPGASTTVCFSGNPAPKLLRSRADLEAYRDEPIQPFDLTNLMEACEGYDDAWFETHDLLLISLCSVPASEMPEVTAIYEQDSQWYFCFAAYPDSTEAQHQAWHILIETEKDLIESADAITLIFE